MVIAGCTITPLAFVSVSAESYFVTLVDEEAHAVATRSIEVGDTGAESGESVEQTQPQRSRPSWFALGAVHAALPGDLTGARLVAFADHLPGDRRRAVTPRGVDVHPPMPVEANNSGVPRDSAALSPFRSVPSRMLQSLGPYR